MSSKWQSCDSTCLLKSKSMFFPLYFALSPCESLLPFQCWDYYVISLWSLKHLTSSKHKPNIYIAAKFPNLKFEFHLSLCFSLQQSGGALNPHLISTDLFSLNVSEEALSLRKATCFKVNISAMSFHSPPGKLCHHYENFLLRWSIFVHPSNTW